MKNDIIKMMALVAFFLILCEHITLINIVTGVLIAALVYAVFGLKENSLRYLSPKLCLKWIKYGAVLFVEVVKANIQVASITLSRKMDVEPMVVSYTSRLSDTWLLTILANSITLTPGTMTVDIEKSQLTIHCLNRHYSESLSDMSLEKLLYDIEESLNG